MSHAVEHVLARLKDFLQHKAQSISTPLEWKVQQSHVKDISPQIHHLADSSITPFFV